MVTRISVLAALCALGCSDQLVDPSGEHDGNARYAEDTAEAELILRAANELTRVELDDEVPLDRRAALNIVYVRSGPDEVDGTDDDTPIASLGELDAIPYVTESAMEAMLDYASERWLILGVMEGGEDAALILSVANTTDPDRLEDRAGLSTVAAFSIFEGRIGPDGQPGTGDDTLYTSLSALASVQWVDQAVFEALLAWGQSQNPGFECPPQTILSSDGKTMFQDLKSAMEQSPDGTVLDVCQGWYFPLNIHPNSVTLRGRGVEVTVLEGWDGRMFDIDGGRTVTFEGLTFRGMRGPMNLSGAAIRSAADSAVVVRDSDFVDHQVRGNVNDGTSGYGGAIHASGRVELERVRFVDNRAGKGGGAIYASGVLDLREVTFADNEAGFEPSTVAIDNSGGGAVRQYGGSLIGDRVSLVGNTSNDRGGAFYLVGNASLTLVDSEILSNTALHGGAIVIGSGTVEATNVDFGWSETDNTGGDVWLANNAAVFNYREGTDIRCTTTTCR